MMFGFDGMMGMLGNYDDRMVARHETDGLLVDTCMVTDSDSPYETAVCHPEYNNDSLVIVELYETEEDAQAGHDRWVAIMTADKLPASLTDVSTADCIAFGRVLLGDEPFDEGKPRMPIE